MLFSNHRSHSKPLDLHLWSDHPEINIIVDKVWQSLGEHRQANLIPTGNRKGTHPKLLLKVLLVHLYVNFLDLPTLWTGVARSANAYAPTSRYNSLRISFKIVKLIDGLVELGYLDFEGGVTIRITRDGTALPVEYAHLTFLKLSLVNVP